VCVRRISLDGEGNALYSMLSYLHFVPFSRRTYSLRRVIVLPIEKDDHIFYKWVNSLAIESRVIYGWVRTAHAHKRPETKPVCCCHPLNVVLAVRPC